MSTAPRKAARRDPTRRETAAALRRALARGELLVHYQPEVSLATGEVIGYEALVRWRHPGRGLLAPAEFIDVAEETGLVVELGAWVLREACQQVRSWRAEEPWHPLRMSVNLSARQLADAHLPEKVSGALGGMDPCALCLEITETSVMEDPELAWASMTALKRLGVGLALDDFGIGYSSLHHIRQLPAVDMLKIDRSFIREIDRRREDRAIVAAVISLAHALGQTVVAEGVEEQRQADVLTRLGCDNVQGFGYGRPLPAAAIDVSAGHASMSPTQDGPVTSSPRFSR